ncbi:transcriptional regulator family: Fungal Specific TF [Penicillium nucicola]|uniref:transcriptional regulator family: Fungal Specific TF n=1 Tax=Penicillium nucicola TaxID=1850975 RepID=UPI0025456BDD|nr:transcriptional regulator family: Fungal Specific TF [Penicillium nucicola]KAJ5742463.1 transcriptional regulator family: Fungal Specific TF [Penicillium nucicola]
MVYDGKPSKGCGNCRSRKIRCDQARPACWECIRTNRECSGYRDELALMFRDQNESVIRKAHSHSFSASKARASRNCGNCRAVKRRYEASAHDDRFDAQCDQQSPHCGQCLRLRETCPGYRDEWDLIFRDQTHRTIQRSKGLETQGTHDVPWTRTLSPNADEVGVHYFLRNFVSHSSLRGCLNYIPSVYHSEGENPTLVASMAAVGLVALANSTQQPELADLARTKYMEAIRNVNAALCSPVESVKDSTLMSVISLGVFEHVSEYKSWARHVQGAAALVVARGEGQFTTPASVLMFNQVRADLVLDCVHAGKPFPESMMELQEEAANHTDVSGAFWLLGVLGTRCANLLMGVRENTGETPWPVYLEQASLLEREFQSLLVLLAIQEPYQTTHDSASASEFIHNGRVDLYKDPWAIRVWNNLRNLHMIVCEILLYLLNKILVTDITLSTTVQESLKMKLRMIMHTLSTLGDDILATIPQALEFLSSASADSPSVDISFRGSVSGGYILTWCLYMVGKCPVTNAETRKWIIRRLQDFGRNMGISIALRLVQDIQDISKKDQSAGVS